MQDQIIQIKQEVTARMRNKQPSAVISFTMRENRPESMTLDPAEEYDRVFVITASSEQVPMVRVGVEVDIFHPNIRACIIEDAQTGLMVAYNEDESVIVDNCHYLLGQFVMFQCAESGRPVSVTPTEYLKAMEMYRSSRGIILCGPVRLRAIRIMACQ